MVKILTISVRLIKSAQYSAQSYQENFNKEFGPIIDGKVIPPQIVYINAQRNQIDISVF